MKKARMTVKELKELKPSMENPIELVCDDGYCEKWHTSIKIVAVQRDMIAVIDVDGDLGTLGIGCLAHYPSLKDEPKYETLYECVDRYGSIKILFSDGRFPLFNTKRKSDRTKNGALTRKTGRTFQLNMETWEISK